MNLPPLSLYRLTYESAPLLWDLIIDYVVLQRSDKDR